ncbi:MAG TPA: sugar ABC transporter permease [Chloroflexota bacterium]|nr:sugar ABC transporter permease [Chloroflexota bacterium]
MAREVSRASERSTPSRAMRFARRHGWSYFFAAPSMLFLFVFWIYPVLRSVMLGFSDLNLRTGETTFVGLENFQQSFATALFWTALRNAVVYTVVVVPVSLLIVVVLSVLVFRLPSAGQTFFKSAFYLPAVTSVAVLALVWKWLFNPVIGLLNYLLGLVSLPAQQWLGNPDLALPSLMLLALAGGQGAGVVLLTAAMGSIPREVYDAARIDGANTFAEVWNVTLPLLRPTLLYLLIIATIGSFQLFGPVYLMTSGGPDHATTTIVYYIYQQAFEEFQFGYASAMALIFMVILIGISFLQYTVFSSDVEY